MPTTRCAALTCLVALLAGCGLLGTRTPTELVLAPAPAQGEAITPALRDEIRAAVALKLERDHLRGTVAVDGDRIRVVLERGVMPKALQALRDDLGHSVRLGFHEVDDAAMRAAGAELPPGATLAEDGPRVSIRAPDRASAEATARTLQPRLTGGRLAAPMAPEGAKDPWEILVLAPAALDQRAVNSAELLKKRGVFGDLTVAMELNPDGARALAEMSRRLLHRRIAIVVNGRVLMAPIVQSEIPGGRVQVTFGARSSPQERQQAAQDLVASLTRGTPTPVPLRLVSERPLP